MKPVLVKEPWPSDLLEAREREFMTDSEPPEDPKAGAEWAQRRTISMLWMTKSRASGEPLYRLAFEDGAIYEVDEFTAVELEKLARNYLKVRGD